MTLSVVVITYNRAALLRDCLASLVRQDFPREQLEILVVDDGSTDDTAQVVGAHAGSPVPVRYCYQEHGGIPAARNTGVSAASGEIVAIVADDYLLPPAYAREIVDFFEDAPEAQAMRFKMLGEEAGWCSRVCHFYYEVSVRNLLSWRDEGEVRGWRALSQKALRKLPPPSEQVTTANRLEAAGGAAFRRQVFETVGSFDERLRRCEDTDFSRRMRERGIETYYNPSLAIRRRYGASFLRAFRASVVAGYHFSRYQMMTGEPPSSRPRWLLRQAAELVVMPIWRARHADRWHRFILYLPFMYWLELGAKLGVVWPVLTRDRELAETGTAGRLRRLRPG